MKNVTAIGVVALLFVTGVAAGVLGTHAYYAHRIQQPDQLPNLGARWHVRSLRRQLNLTPQQERAMTEILHRTRREVRDLRGEFLPQVRDRVETAHREFVATLTPAQRERLHDIIHRHRRRYMRAFGIPDELALGLHEDRSTDGRRHAFGHRRDGAAADDRDDGPPRD